MQRYNPKEIEPKWQKTWQESKIYEAKDFDARPKYVMLTEFPYPSGSGMHVGHIREYTLGDVMARHKRMQGYNVLFPMGYDAFGLPTENYAIKNKISPQKATDENVAVFQSQLEAAGFSFDWDRCFRTSDPDYYKWTQWLFLQFFKAGLAYQDEIAINWCPFCKTGLANEEVINGRHERCDTPVEKKLLKQWLLKITEYADRLIEGLQTVDYPSRIADQQINWIGRSKGAEVEFAVESSEVKIKVFTTRPDTLYGATFMVLAPEHPAVDKIATASQKSKVKSYKVAAQAKSDIERQETDREKTGVFTGAYAINPANDEKIPIWISDYVLMGYGTGAIMAVPAHDDRDGEFARKHNLPIVEVIEASTFDDENPPKKDKKNTKRNVAICVVKNAQGQYLTLKWNKLNWHNFVMGGIEDGEKLVEAAKREIAEETGYTDVEFKSRMPFALNSVFYAAHKDVNRDIRVDVLLFELKSNKQIDAQRGDHEDFEPLWVEKSELKNLHPVGGLNYIVRWLEEGDYAYSGEGRIVNSGKYDGMSSSEMRDKIVADLAEKGVATEKVNYRLRDWIFSRQHYWGEPIPIIHCPEHGAVPVPDDQLPVTLPEVEHYEPTDTGESPLAAIEDWVTTTCPTCGKPARRETDTMPNWAGSSWYYLRYFDAHNDQAFAAKDKLGYWGAVDMYLGGMEHTTLHLLYSRFWHQFFYDQGLVPTPEPYQARRGQGIILAADGNKMSKSKGNVVNPTEVIESGYGADALRLSIAFLAPYDQTTPWSPEGVAGTYRFINRVWNLVQEFHEASHGENESAELKHVVNKAVKKVSDDLHNMSFNTAIATLMELTNELYRIKAVENYQAKDWQWVLESLLKLLAPFAPHIADELWHQLDHEESIHTSEWPVHDEKYLISDTVKIVVQVNGKLRGQVEVAKDSQQADVETAAKSVETVKTHLKGEPKRVIYVPNKLLNFVA